MPTLKSYLKLLEKNAVPVDCPHCRDSVPAKHFQEHCFARHGLDPDTHCAWCSGNTFWTPHDNRFDHLAKCYSIFLSFRETLALPPPLHPATDTPALFDTNLPCEERTFGNDRVPLPDLPESPVWAVQPPVRGPTFQCPRLDLAAACMQLYLSLRDSADWMHVVVKPPAFRSFLKAIEADDGKTRTLPFSCLCAGGGVPHRHFVVLSTPRNHFSKNTWKKIQCVKKNENVKREAIRSPMQLLCLLGSLGQDRSECDFSFRALGPDPEGESNHYYVVLALPPVYKIVLALQWDGGLSELVYEKYGRLDPLLLAPVAQSFDGLLAVRFRDLPGLEKNGVLPVSKEFRPTANPTEFYVHLVRGEKMYFERCDQTPQDWEKDQAERGNVFYDVLGETLFYPTPHQQKYIRVVKPVVDEMKQLQCLTEEICGKVREFETTVDGLRKTNRNLKRKYNKSEAELKSLQCRHIRYLEKENDKLRLERDTLKRIRTDDRI